MTWYDEIIAAHTAVTDSVSHCYHLKNERYFVWTEDGSNDLAANDRHAERAISGTTDLYTKMEFDPWIAALEKSLDEHPSIVWRYNSFQYEEDTKFYHHEWMWQVLCDGGN